LTESAYASAEPLFGTAPSWVPEEHADRVRAYQLYEDIYWTKPQTFKLTTRGKEREPIYIPTGRTIVDTTARYVAKGFGFAVRDSNDPTLTVSDVERSAAQFAFEVLFKRERFFSNFHSAKLYGIMRGDWLFHVFADPAKVVGRRISIQTVKPSSYYPVFSDPADPESLRAVLLAEPVIVDGKELIRRQLYRRLKADDGTVTIMSHLGYFKPDKWFLGFEATDPSEEEPAEQEILAEAPLDPRITAIPVYHIRNNPSPNAPFGSSEQKGLESIFAAVNRTISDEDLTLALMGLGMYATPGGGPKDDKGNALDWILGPGRVLENAENFKRVDGITSVGPYLDHAKFLIDSSREATGANDAAVGKVDVAVAESGIALALRLDPLLSRVDFYDLHVVDVTSNMYYDLATSWYPVFEATNFGALTIDPTLGDKLPVNRKERFLEMTQMLNLGVVDTKWFLLEAQKLGYTFPDGIEAMVAAAMAEQQARTAAATPPEQLSAGTPADTGPPAIGAVA
jgi:hypothetical protein